MWGQIAAFAAPKVLNFLKGKGKEKIMGAVNNRLQGGGGGGSSFGVDQSAGGGVDYGSGNARYTASTTMDPNSLAIQQEALNKLRGMGGNLEGNLAAADAEAERLRAIAIDENVKRGSYAQGATRGQYTENQVNTDLINTRAGIRNADQAQQLQIGQAMGQIGAQGQGTVDYGRETSNLEKFGGALTTGLGLYNQLSPEQGLLDRLGLTRGEEDKEKIDTVGGMNKEFMPSLGNRTSMGQTFNNQLSGGGTSMGQAFGRGLTERRLPRTSARKGFNFMGKPENQFRLGGWG